MEKKIHKGEKNLDSREIIDGGAERLQPRARDDLRRERAVGDRRLLQRRERFTRPSPIIGARTACRPPIAACTNPFPSARNPACWRRITARPTRWKRAASCSFRAAIRSMTISTPTATPSHQYLGEFATLKSTNDIANHICQIHDAYTAAQQPLRSSKHRERRDNLARRRISSSALHRISPTIPAGESIPPSARCRRSSPSPRLITCSRSAQ